MFQESVDLKNGHKKTVVASSKEELAEAVRAARAEVESKAFDINVPLQKGHDLVATDAAHVQTLVDGTGAHNSPLDAINEDTGEVRGSDPLFVVANDTAPERKVYEVVGSGETKEVDESKLSEPTTAEKQADVASTEK